ncbi:MAG: Glycerate dehydrogenase, partial [Pseudomonadota bacterium]
MSLLPQIFVTDLITEPLDCERRVLDGHAEVRALNVRSQEELGNQIDEADGVMLYHYLRLDRPQIERLKKCRIIARPGVGYDNIDIVAARERGIPVVNVPDYGTEEVADSALGMALTLTRGAHLLNSRLRRGLGAWNVTQAAPVHRLRGRVFGIIGCGRIGSATALRAKSFGFQVVIYDPF